MSSLANRCALVSGAGRGLGRAIATSFVEAGATVCVVSRNAAELEDFVATVGGRAVAFPADIRQPDDLDRLRDAVLSEVGVVDILVNNAGNLVKKPVVPLPTDGPVGQPGSGPASVAMTDDEWDSVLDTHVRGSLHLVRSFVPGMLSQGRGRVINIASSSVARSANLTVSYQVAKGALLQLTRSLAKEWAAYGVTVNTIAPGHFRTSMTKALHDSPEGQAWLRERIPMRRTGDAAELGALAVHLAGDLASFITGQTIFVDGGETL
ncbi:SDR family NAD(P)-dependent oxidoreductase [Dactylosporangium sucinum]|uniref:2-deoxy-D-gluconate 3-dehydrogenase n=1 Tax=Dactylosporangium sucinum TaxID=1424081 RepID=A0A917TWD6_9ACTN|nr:SDR family oxidoreductase [Dactylosporangium sucinum]GGM40810.1 2-deoxy-D-gluconate 3-dehydrogenase [Dactylosporangium sucinum]